MADFVQKNGVCVCIQLANWRECVCVCVTSVFSICLFCYFLPFCFCWFFAQHFAIYSAIFRVLLSGCFFSIKSRFPCTLTALCLYSHTWIWANETYPRLCVCVCVRVNASECCATEKRLWLRCTHERCVSSQTSSFILVFVQKAWLVNWCNTVVRRSVGYTLLVTVPVTVFHPVRLPRIFHFARIFLMIFFSLVDFCFIFVLSLFFICRRERMWTQLANAYYRKKWFLCVEW